MLIVQKYGGTSVGSFDRIRNVARRIKEKRDEGHEVAVVVNEFGETIGILTSADILATLFHANPSRSDRLLDREPIQQISEGVWHVIGMTSVRRLERYFQVKLPAANNVTIGGVMQDLLQRMAEKGDEVNWGPFSFRVLKAPRRGQLLIEMRRLPRVEEPQ